MRGSAAPLWPLPALIALVLTAAPHAAWLLSTHAGTVPSCIPYLEGCTSISRAARDGLANAVCRLGMLPASTAIGLHWWLAARGLRDHGAARTVRAAGLVAAVALAVYATFLGTEGEAYRFLRRYGVVVFFGAGFLAQLAFLRGLGARDGGPAEDVARQCGIGDGTGSGSRIGNGAAATLRWLRGVCIAMLAIGVAHVAALWLAGGSAFQDRFENVLEWWLGVGLVAWYVAHAWLWRQAGVGIQLTARDEPRA